MSEMNRRSVLAGLLGSATVAGAAGANTTPAGEAPAGKLQEIRKALQEELDKELGNFIEGATTAELYMLLGIMVRWESVISGGGYGDRPGHYECPLAWALHGELTREDAEGFVAVPQEWMVRHVNDLIAKLKTRTGA